jgi:hypothetical protein
MPYRSWLERRAKPRTYVGRWLRATFLRQQELRKELDGTMNGGNPGWNDDEPAVVEFASQLVLRRLFGDEYDGRVIEKFVDLIRTATDGDPPVDQLNATMLIRNALGESEIEVSKIDSGQRFVLRALAAATAAYILDLDEAAVDEIITDSERIAFERGWKPPLVRRDNR